MKIGVFDSGLGGLTVVRELRRLCPHAEILYLGDTARVPYGIRSDVTIRQYASECAGFLAQQGVEALVVACNTVSALALDTLKQGFPMPVFGVIEPGAQAALKSAGDLPIGVLGTMATVESRAYEKAVHALSPQRLLVSQAAPLLVPLVEEGWISGDVPRQVIRRYLTPLLEKNIGSLILGCTHYPLLKQSFQEELQAVKHQDVVLIDSGIALAQELHGLIETSGTRTREGRPGSLRVFVTDAPRRFQKLAESFLGEAIQRIEPIHLS